MTSPGRREIVATIFAVQLLLAPVAIRALPLQPTANPRTTAVELFERNDGQLSSFSLWPRAFEAADPIRFSLVGGESPRAARAEGESAYRTNYFSGKAATRSVTDVRHFSRVTFDGVYPGVALSYYPAGGRLEYDFVVAPGVDAGQISWRVEGAQRISLNESGDLLVEAPAGNFVKRRPNVYQHTEGGTRKVESAYRVVAEGRVGFDIGQHDRTQPLIIDPVVEYASYLGGSNTDTPAGIAFGPDGFIYVVGTTQSTDFPTTSAYSARLGGTSDAFVSKINPATGALVYSTYLGDARNPDRGMGIAVDASGNVFVTGLAGTKFPTTAGSWRATSAVKSGFLTKLSSAGNSLLYSTLIPGSNPSGLALDSLGRVAITGTAGTGFATTTGAWQATSRGDNSGTSTDLVSEGDAFVLLMNAAGNAPVFSTYFGGTSHDNAGGVAIDSNANVWLAGTTRSLDLSLQGAFQASNAGRRDAFIAVFSVTGALVASSYLGGSLDERNIAGVAADPFGNVLIAGNTETMAFPLVNPILSGGSLFRQYLVPNKGFVAKLALNPLRQIFSTFLGGNTDGGDEISSLSVDRAGDIHVAGRVSADVFNRFPLLNSFVSSAQILSRYTNGDASFAIGLRRDGQLRRYASLLAPCGEATFCGLPAIGSRLAGEVAVAGSTYAEWLPIAVANTRPRIAGKLPFPQDGFVMTLDLYSPSLELGASSSLAPSNSTVTLNALSYGGLASGTVNFTDGATALGSAPLIDGIATLTTALPVGIRAVRAALGAAQSNSLNISVYRASSVCP
jgi:Beta-propeller repeat